MQVKRLEYVTFDAYQRRSPLEGEWTHLDGEGTHA
jgi:hypothetical protein